MTVPAQPRVGVPVTEFGNGPTCFYSASVLYEPTHIALPSDAQARAAKRQEIRIAIADELDGVSPPDHRFIAICRAIDALIYGPEEAP